MRDFDIYDLSLRLARQSKAEIKTYIDILSCLEYKQVCKGESYKKHSTQYALNYTIYFGHTATVTSFYLFSKEKADLICNLMSTMTKKCQAYLNNAIDTSAYSTDIKEQLHTYLRSVGYKVNSIKEVTDWQKSYAIKRVSPNIKRRREYELRANACPRCGGGGCPDCEPYFFR